MSAELYPRLPAGLRASVSLVFGVIGLVTGVVQVDRLRVEGVSASALCGLLPLAAGAVLVCLGVWLTWTSRKRGGPLWWTILRRALIALVALFVVYWLVLPVSMAIVATERPNVPVKAVDLGRPHEKVTLTTRDGLTWAPGTYRPLNHAAVVTFPRAWTIRQARMLVKQGYGVLLVDPRGYGDERGRPQRLRLGVRRATSTPP